MTKRIVLVNDFGDEMFSGTSVLREVDEDAARDAVPTSGTHAVAARQSGTLESGVFHRVGAEMVKRKHRAA